MARKKRRKRPRERAPRREGVARTAPEGPGPSWRERVEDGAPWIAGFGGPIFMVVVMLAADLARASRIVGYPGYVLRGVAGGLLVALVVYLVLSAYVKWARDERLTHLPLLAAIGFTCVAGAGLGLGPSLYNVLLDVSEPVVRELEVVSTEVRTAKRVKTRVAVVKSWIDAGETFEVPIRAAWRVEQGTRLRAVTRRGAIGWTWVQEVLPP